MPEQTGVLLGFDFGGRRIGVAVGQGITGTASALAVVGNGQSGPDWSAIDRLMREWKPSAIVVGLPLTLSGEEQPVSVAARAFASRLAERYQVPVSCHDERYSSRHAEQAFALARSRGEARRKDAALLDAQAARMILENFLAQQAAGPANLSFHRGN